MEGAVYAEIIADRDKIGDWNVSVGLGKLACAVISSKDADMVYGEKMFEALDKLTPREKNVLFLRFGLDGNGDRTLQEVGDFFELTRERIREIENKSIRKLSSRSYMKIFYIPYIIEDKTKSIEEKPIEWLGFSVRTYNALKRNGFNTIGDIFNNPSKLVISARNFGKKSAMEILEFLENSGLANDKGKSTKEILEEFINK